MSERGTTSVHLFGPPRIEQAGRALPFGRQRGLALLAVLAAEARPQARDRLLGLLWPTFGPDEARNNLRRELSLLRGALGDALLADRHTVELDPAALADGRLDVDVLAFDRLLADVAAHHHPGVGVEDDARDASCDACLARLSEAAARYGDDFLAGFALPDSPAFDEWRFFREAQYRRAAQGVFERLAARHEAGGAYDRALDAARRWLALDPLHEPAHRALMRLYEASGQHAAALRQYETLRRGLREELDATPEPETAALLEAIRSRQLPLPPAVQPPPGQPPPGQPPPVQQPAVLRPHVLPADATPFIGRAAELAQLDGLLADPAVRLVTILGVGGMGKTRLALAAARRVDDGATAPFADGVIFVPLALVGRPADLTAALAHALGLALAGDAPPEPQLAGYLASRRLLLLLDNMEHLAGAETGELLQAILRQASGVKLLATSRVRLGLSGEHLFALGGMSVRDNDGPVGLDDGATAGSAVALFAEAARRVEPAFRLDESNLPAVVRICQLVQGMPLGIELAAGWLELLPPDAIAAEIERSLDFLATDHTDLPPRQASLRAVFESSWRLLTPAEQAALARLTVFAGGFDRAAAEHVAGASLRTLLSLANKSWLQRAGPERYQIHELLCQYAAQQLASDERAALQEQRALYVAGLLAALNDQMKGRRPAAAFDALAADQANVRAALVWLSDAGRFDVLITQVLPALFRYFESRYQYTLFAPLLTEARQRAQALGLAREYAILLMIHGNFSIFAHSMRLVEYPWIHPLFRQLMGEAWEPMPSAGQADFWSILLAWQYGRYLDAGLGIERLGALQRCFEHTGRRWEEALTWQGLGHLLQKRPDDAAQFGGAGACLQRARALFEALGDERESAITLLLMGVERWAEGDQNTALGILLDARQRLHDLGEHLVAGSINWHLAEIHLQEGQLDESLAYLLESADMLLRSGRAREAIGSLSRGSYEAVRYGDLAYARQLRERSLALSRQTGSLYNEAWDVWEMGELLRVMGHTQEARSWFERSRPLFIAAHTEDGQSFYNRGLADCALAEGDYTQAEAYFAECLTWADRTGHPWQQAYALTGLGKSALAAGRPDDARTWFVRALRMGGPAVSAGLTLAALPAVAHLFRALGNTARAEEVARLVLSHPLAWNETRGQAAALLGLPADAIPARPSGIPFDALVLAQSLADELDASPRVQTHS